MQSKADEFKKKYEEGYRCIYKEKEQNGYTYHLKDFGHEKIQTLRAKNQMEIGEIDDFLDYLEGVKQKQGMECPCISDERDQE